MDFMTSTMKSDPVRSAVKMSASGGTAISAAADMTGVAVAGARCGANRAAAAGIVPAGAASAAALAAAARFRKLRRSTDAFTVRAIAFLPLNRQDYKLLHIGPSPADRRHWSIHVASSRTAGSNRAARRHPGADSHRLHPDARAQPGPRPHARE